MQSLWKDREHIKQMLEQWKVKFNGNAIATNNMDKGQVNAQINLSFK